MNYIMSHLARLGTAALIVTAISFLTNSASAQTGPPGGGGGTASLAYTGQVTNVTLTKTGNGPWHLKGNASFEIVVADDEDPLTNNSYEFRADVRLYAPSTPLPVQVWSDERNHISVSEGQTKNFSMGNGHPGEQVSVPGQYSFTGTIYPQNITGMLDTDTKHLQVN